MIGEFYGGSAAEHACYSGTLDPNAFSLWVRFGFGQQVMGGGRLSVQDLCCGEIII